MEHVGYNLELLAKNENILAELILPKLTSLIDIFEDINLRLSHQN